MGSASLAAARQAAHPPARTVTTIPLQPWGLRGKNPCAWHLWFWSSRGQLALCNPWGLMALWVLSSTHRVTTSVKNWFKMGFCFYPTLKKQTQPLYPLKTVSKDCDLSLTIDMTAHCFGAFSQVRTTGHCMIGQEHDLFCPDWPHWWVCPWVPAFQIQIFLWP